MKTFEASPEVKILTPKHIASLAVERFQSYLYSMEGSELLLADAIDILPKDTSYIATVRSGLTIANRRLYPDSPKRTTVRFDNVATENPTVKVYEPRLFEHGANLVTELGLRRVGAKRLAVEKVSKSTQYEEGAPMDAPITDCNKTVRTAAKIAHGSVIAHLRQNTRVPHYSPL